MSFMCITPLDQGVIELLLPTTETPSVTGSFEKPASVKEDPVSGSQSVSVIVGSSRAK